MKLLLDAGNTRLKLGWLSDNGEREVEPLSCEPAELESQLTAWLASLPGKPSDILASSVLRHDSNASLQAALTAHTGCKVHWLQAQTHYLQLRNEYRHPGRLGVDRWLAMLGLWRHPQHAEARQAGTVQVLASFGTATTVDTLTADGVFQGGLILPGVALMRRSLHQGTARLPHQEGELADYPVTTESAIHSGIVSAQAGAVWRQVALSRRAWPDRPCRLLTSGGAWPEVASIVQHEGSLRHPDVTVQWLDRPVLDGLQVVATAQAPLPRSSA